MPVSSSSCSFTDPVIPVSWPQERIEKLYPYMLTGPEERFGRILFRWNEIKPSGTIQVHNYAACVDTKEWEFYIDCRPRKIFAKCLVQLFVRPLHAIIKTIHHLLMIPVFVELKNAIQGKQSLSTCLKNSVRSIADIVRTPLYSLAMMITTIVVLGMGCYSPELLYDGRMVLGKIEQSANWGEKQTAWTLSPCFQPFSISDLDAVKYSKQYPNTQYESDDEVDVRMGNYARSFIHYMRLNYDLFGGCIVLDSNVEYMSPVLSKDEV